MATARSESSDYAPAQGIVPQCIFNGSTDSDRHSLGRTWQPSTPAAARSANRPIRPHCSAAALPSTWLDQPDLPTTPREIQEHGAYQTWKDNSHTSCLQPWGPLLVLVRNNLHICRKRTKTGLGELSLAD